MNKNMIQNTKTEVPSGINLNDKDYMNSLLSTLKELAKNYTVVLTEASNEKLYKEYKKAFDNIITMQRETYELMFKNGWYSLEQAEKTKIDNKYKMFCQELNDLNTEE